MTIPPHFVVCRLAAVTITVLILLAAGWYAYGWLG